MVEGETFNLVATILPKDAEYDGVIWASSNASVASVNSGTVTAIKGGTATITASAGGKSATCTVKVSAKIIAVTSVSLDKTSLSMQVGETETITATVKPDDATDKTVTWLSSDESVVKVDNGKVTALKVGQARITAAVGNITVSCDVVVYQSDNVIIYTTTDKKVLKPYNEDAFGSTIVSNTYVGDVGIIIFEKPLTFIGNMAFYRQSKLQSIVIPNAVTTIGIKAFCSSGLRSIVLPDSINSIGEYAFEYCMFSEINLPGNLKEIGKCAFFRCSNLKSLTLPDGLVRISTEAFAWCKGLLEIVIPKSVHTLGSYAFANCESLNKVEILEGLTYVPLFCFVQCYKLATVILPSTISKIGESALRECIRLKDLYISAQNPPELEYSSAFKDCGTDYTFWVPRASVDAYKEKWSAYKDNIKGYDF